MFSEKHSLPKVEQGRTEDQILQRDVVVQQSKAPQMAYSLGEFNRQYQQQATPHEVFYPFRLDRRKPHNFGVGQANMLPEKAAMVLQNASKTSAVKTPGKSRRDCMSAASMSDSLSPSHV